MASFCGFLALGVTILLCGSLTDVWCVPECLDEPSIQNLITCLQRHGMELRDPLPLLSKVDVCLNQQKIANAYGCVLDAARHCFEQIRYDDDEDIESFLRHLELYLPDPSMVSDDIRYKCEHEKDMDFSCLSEKGVEMGLETCFQDAIQKMATSIGNGITREAASDIKSAICVGYRELFNCVTDSVKNCPGKTLDVLKTWFYHITPPVCQAAGVNEGSLRAGDGNAEFVRPKKQPIDEL